MKEHLVYIAKLTSLAFFNWIKLNILGTFSTIITFVIGLIVILNQVDTGHAGHAGVLPVFIVMFLTKPLGSILLILIFLCNFLFVALSNKYVVGKVINKIVNDKAESHMLPVIDKILSKFKDNQPNLIKNGADYGLVKLKLIDQVKKESDNRWIKKAICFGMEKIRLDDVDFNNENLSFNEIIKQKLFTSLKQMSAPSMANIWYVVLFQWLALLVIAFVPY